MLEQLILVAHLLLSLAIIGLIMLQQGKGAEMGASFGAGASQTLFGSAGGGNVLTRITAWMVALFFVLSFGLAVIAKNKVSPGRELAIPLPAEPAPDDLPAAVQDRPPLEDGDLPTLEEFTPMLTPPDGTQDRPPLEDGDLPTLEEFTPMLTPSDDTPDSRESAAENE